MYGTVSTHLQLRGPSNVLICLRSCCAIVLDVFFVLLLCFKLYILVVVAQFCAITVFHGHLPVQEFLPWCSISVSEIDRNWGKRSLRLSTTIGVGAGRGLGGCSPPRVGQNNFFSGNRAIFRAVYISRSENLVHV